MAGRKNSSKKGDIQNFKEEIVHEFHVISEGIISHVKRVAEGVSNVNEKLDRTRKELKMEIQETRQELLAAIKFSYAELDRRLTTLEKEFLDLKHRVEKNGESFRFLNLPLFAPSSGLLPSFSPESSRSVGLFAIL